MVNKNKHNDIQESDLVYVSDNLAIEPLIDQWYAWSHLLSPTTACLNIKNRHLAILNSYIQFPAAHAEAIKKAEMLGGPFIDYDGKRVDEIEALRDRTLIECSYQLEFASSIIELFTILNTSDKGYSLGTLYPKVPEMLKGLVELYYDIDNNPSFRFLEPLVYNSKAYNESLQSINLMMITDDVSRSFVLSTPRLPNKSQLSRNYSFCDPRIDKLFGSWSNPVKFSDLKRFFEITPEEEPLFKTFFTKSDERKYNRYRGEGVLTRYFGHACILIETKDMTILVDPLISYGVESDISRYTFADLPDKIDFLLITHNHQDHVLFETLLRLRHKVDQVIIPRGNGGELQDPSLKFVFEKLGFKKITELTDLETINFQSCSITGIPFMGEHCDLNIRTKMCYMVNYGNSFKMLFAADSCNQEPMLYNRIHSIVGDINVIFLGMECDGAPMSWIYGPLLPNQLERKNDQSRRLAGCNFIEAKGLIDTFNPQEVFVYAMGMEPWLKFISSIKYTDESRPIIESNRILDYCTERGITSQRLYGEKILEYFITDH